MKKNMEDKAVILYHKVSVMLEVFVCKVFEGGCCCIISVKMFGRDKRRGSCFKKTLLASSEVIPPNILMMLNKQ